jgi:hypothetical protein
MHSFSYGYPRENRRNVGLRAMVALQCATLPVDGRHVMD